MKIKWQDLKDIKQTIGYTKRRKRAELLCKSWGHENIRSANSVGKQKMYELGNLWKTGAKTIWYKFTMKRKHKQISA